MRVTLIYPRDIHETRFPPLGLMYIGAVLKNAGHSVKIIDPASQDTGFIKTVQDFNPQIIGISIMTTSYPRAVNLLRKLREKIPDVVYCAGGIHVTALPIKTLEDLNLDFVVIGEGEFTMREVCERLENGGNLDGVKGIIYRDRSKDKLINNGPRDFIQNLDDLPFPNRDLLPSFEKYLLPSGVIYGFYFQRSTTIFASRGCPFHCIYCGSHLIFGRKVRLRSVDNVIAEIEDLIKKYDIEALYFLDDTFTLNSKWVTEFCRQMREKKIQISWACQARVDTVSEDLLSTMKRAGCVSVEFGVESGSDEVLKVMKKGISREKIIKAFDDIRKVGLTSSAYFMLGNPGEKHEDINQTFKVAKRIKANRTRFYFTVPFPGTELDRMAKENSWYSPDMNFTELLDFYYSEYPTMEINLTKEELAEIRKKFENYFILRNHLSGHINYQGILRALLILLKSPKRTFTNFVIFAKNKQWARFITYLVEEYRKAFTKYKR